jgi:hypothetical protein
MTTVTELARALGFDTDSPEWREAEHAENERVTRIRASLDTAVRTMPLADVLRDYQDGDEHGWDTEFQWLRENDAERLRLLTDSIRREGIKQPIVLGPDGRVWDGHHRLCVAGTLGITSVPVITPEAVE